MGFDFTQNRRNCNEFCKWWSRNEGDENLADEIIMKRIPTGQFWAEEITGETVQNTQVGNTFMFDRFNVTIRSPDNILGIKNNDLVLYQEEK